MSSRNLLLKSARPSALVLVMLLLLGTGGSPAGAASISYTTMGQQLTGELTNTEFTEAVCYQVVVPLDQMDDAVTQFSSPKILFNVEPTAGMPHMRISTYGCPNDGFRYGLEYMNTQMINSLKAAGTPVPAYWEWPGDQEIVTASLSHQQWFVAVYNYNPSGRNFRGPVNPAAWKFSSRIFDAAVNSADTLVNFLGISPSTWNRTVEVGSKEGIPAGSSAIEFFPPGMGTRSSPANPPSGVDSLEYQFYVLDISSYVGNSKEGYIQSVVSPPKAEDGSELCGPSCVEGACDDCLKVSPNCYKAFDADCKEVTFNISGLKTALSVYADVDFDNSGELVDGELKRKVPFEFFLNNPNNWTLASAEGIKAKLDWIPSTKVVPDPAYDAETRLEEGDWFKASDLEQGSEPGSLRLLVTGFKNDVNQVYLVNIAVRDATGKAGVYSIATMQASEAVYEPPKIEGTNMAVMIGVGAGLGACLVIFIVVAVWIRIRRKKDLQQRIRNRRKRTALAKEKAKSIEMAPRRVSRAPPPGGALSPKPPPGPPLSPGPLQPSDPMSSSGARQRHVEVS